MTSQRFGSVGLVALALTMVLAVAPRKIANAQSQQAASGRGLEGTWRVEVTLRDCNTGAALGSRSVPFSASRVFATMTESHRTVRPHPARPAADLADGSGHTFRLDLETLLSQPCGRLD